MIENFVFIDAYICLIFCFLSVYSSVISASLLHFNLSVKSLIWHPNIGIANSLWKFKVLNKAISRKDVLNKHEVPQINCVFIEFTKTSKLRLPNDVFWIWWHHHLIRSDVLERIAIRMTPFDIRWHLAWIFSQFQWILAYFLCQFEWKLAYFLCQFQ